MQFVYRLGVVVLGLPTFAGCWFISVLVLDAMTPKHTRYLPDGWPVAVADNPNMIWWAIALGLVPAVIGTTIVVRVWRWICGQGTRDWAPSDPIVCDQRRHRT